MNLTPCLRVLIRSEATLNHALGFATGGSSYEVLLLIDKRVQSLQPHECPLRLASQAPFGPVELGDEELRLIVVISET